VAVLFLWAWVLSSWPLTWATAVLGCAVVGVAILLRPAIGLPLLAVAIPFGSLRTVQVGPAAAGAQEALLGAILAAWLARLVVRRSPAVRWPWLAGAGLPLLGVMLVSFLPATSLPLAAKELIKWAQLWLAILLVLNLADGRDLKLLVLALLVAGAAQGLLGLYQFFTRTGPPGFLLMGRFMRAAGTFRQPNPYGGYLGLTIPLALGITLCGRPGKAAREGRHLWLMWLTAIGAGGLMLGGLIASWSRGAWLGAVAAMAAVVVARGGAWLRGLLAATILGLLLSMLLWGRVPVPGALQERLLGYVTDLATLDLRRLEITHMNYAVVERAAHWQAALGMLVDHPWTGVGLGNYTVAYERYALPRWPDHLGHAHNYYLNVAAETGLPGLAAYLLWVAASLWFAVQAVRAASGLQRGLALGVLGMLLHLSVHNVVDKLYVHGMAIHVGLLLGVAAWIMAQGSEPAAGPNGTGASGDAGWGVGGAGSDG
jgi:O-antigen ligase